MSDYFRQTANVFKNPPRESGWVLLSPNEAKIKSKIEAQGLQLKKWEIQINYGIKTGLNEAFIIDSKKRKELIEKSPESADIIRPILRGRDIRRFNYDWEDEWLIFTRSGIDIERHQPIKNHLLKYYEELKPRNNGEKKGRKPGSYLWYEIQDKISYWQDFDKPKIIYPEITKFINFVLDSNNHFLVNNKCFILTGKYLEYLTCFFNSKLFRFCFLNNFPELLGGTRELRKIFFQEIPVKMVSEIENNAFKSIILDIERNQKNGNSIKPMEEIANDMIFKMFQLSKEEIEIINQFDSEWSEL